MSYRDVAKRLAALEAVAPVLEGEPDPEAIAAAQWAECTAIFEGYVSHRRAHRMLVDQGRKNWSWHQERYLLTYGRRDDDKPLRYLQRVDEMIAEHGEEALRDVGYTVPALDVLGDVRYWLRWDGRIEA
ncbi:MAG: hypothetical protein H0X37_22445 [Herpetosiphonaceae bacterium]|nr:hypothetical protein [Herpetosiphonaceae bacterium]